MEIVAWSPRMTPERAAAENAKAVSLDELLKTSKVVSMHLVAGPFNQLRSTGTHASRFDSSKYFTFCAN